MKITAEDVCRFGIADQIVPEPDGGAHTDPVAAASALGSALRATLDELDRSYGYGETLDSDRLLRDRFTKYRRIGVFDEA
jgi:acetyl-CoA carboxylase carboxyl transferase subunit alpha